MSSLSDPVMAERAALRPGLWLRSGTAVWRLLGTPLPAHLRATKVPPSRSPASRLRALAQDLRRPPVRWVGRTPGGLHSYPLAVATYDGGAVLLDPSGGTVRHVHPVSPLDSHALRSRLARHVATPWFRVEDDGRGVVEEYVAGQPLAGLGAERVVDVLRTLGDRWSDLARAESEGTSAELLDAALKACACAELPLAVRTALDRGVPPAARLWPLVPSAADATTRNVVLRADEPVLIDLVDVRLEPSPSYLLGAVADAGPVVMRHYLDGALDSVLARVAGDSTWPPDPWSRVDALAARTCVVTYLESGPDTRLLSEGVARRWARIARALGPEHAGAADPTPAGADADPRPLGAVVVVNHASADLLEQNLVPLSAQPDLLVVVVDNFSSDVERARVSTLAARHGWELVLQANTGFGPGMNAGVARARSLGAGAYLLLNPDVTVDAVTARALLTHTHRRPEALVTPRVREPDGSESFAVGSLDLERGTTRTRPPLDPRHATWTSGACLAVSARLWGAVGGLAEDYFMYWEDLDLSVRAVAAGGCLVVRDDLVVTHQVGGTQGSGDGRRPLKSPLYRYYNARNRLLFARMHVSRTDRLRWLASTPTYSWRLLRRDGLRVVLRDPLGTVLPVVRGTAAGLALLLSRR